MTRVISSISQNFQIPLTQYTSVSCTAPVSATIIHCAPPKCVYITRHVHNTCNAPSRNRILSEGETPGFSTNAPIYSCDSPQAIPAEQAKINYRCSRVKRETDPHRRSSACVVSTIRTYP